MKRIVPLLSIAILLLNACSGNSEPDPTEVYIAATQTLGAKLETASAQTPTPRPPTQPVPTNTPTAAIVIPSVTAPPTLESVQQDSSTPPTVTLLDEMNCRSGPAIAYRIISSISNGSNFEILGRNSGGTWWLIQGTPENQCWIYNGTSVSFDGITSSIPFAEAPLLPTSSPEPTAAPGFHLGRPLFYECGGKNFMAMPVSSKGGVTFSSGKIRLMDSGTGTGVNNKGNNLFFHTASALCDSKGEPVLHPGYTRYVTIDSSKTSGGNTYRAVVTLCTENGLKGDCYQMAVIFTR